MSDNSCISKDSLGSFVKVYHLTDMAVLGLAIMLLKVHGDLHSLPLAFAPCPDLSTVSIATHKNNADRLLLSAAKKWHKLGTAAYWGTDTIQCVLVWTHITMTAIFMLLAKVVGTQGYSVALAMAALSAWLLTFFEMRTWNKSIGVLIICVSPSPPFVAPPPQSGWRPACVQGALSCLPKSAVSLC